jgi:hypothetical protein
MKSRQVKISTKNSFSISPGFRRSSPPNRKTFHLGRIGLHHQKELNFSASATQNIARLSFKDSKRD